MSTDDEGETDSPLSPYQKQLLEELSTTIEVDRVTVSYSVDVRVDGLRHNLFYSVSARLDGAESVAKDLFGERGCHLRDMQAVRALLSKHVIKGIYDDCVRRRIMSLDDAVDAARTTLLAYDRLLAKSLPDGKK